MSPARRVADRVHHAGTPDTGALLGPWPDWPLVQNPCTLLLVQDRTDPNGVEHHTALISRARRACSWTSSTTFAASTMTRTRSFTESRNWARIWPTSTPASPRAPRHPASPHCTSPHSVALQVGDHRSTRANKIIRRDREHIVACTGRSPFLVVLQSVRINEHTQLRAVAERRDAASGFRNPSVIRSCCHLRSSFELRFERRHVAQHPDVSKETFCGGEETRTHPFHTTSSWLVSQKLTNMNA